MKRKKNRFSYDRCFNKEIKITRKVDDGGKRNPSKTAALEESNDINE